MQAGIFSNPDLTAFVLALGKTILAVYRTVFSRLKRDFAFFFAVGANRFVHLFRNPSVSPAATLLIPHITSFLT
jgi:hypothetical protein